MGCLAKKGCHAAISPSKREKTESLSCSRTFFTSAFPRGQKKGDAVKAQGICVKYLINNVCCKNDSCVVCNHYIMVLPTQGAGFSHLSYLQSQQLQHFSLIVFLCLRSNADFSGDILHRRWLPLRKVWQSHIAPFIPRILPNTQTFPNEKCLHFSVLWKYGTFHSWKKKVPICNAAFKSHMESICVTGI